MLWSLVNQIMLTNLEVYYYVESSISVIKITLDQYLLKYNLGKCYSISIIVSLVS